MTWPRLAERAMRMELNACALDVWIPSPFDERGRQEDAQTMVVQAHILGLDRPP